MVNPQTTKKAWGLINPRTGRLLKECFPTKEHALNHASRAIEWIGGDAQVIRVEIRRVE
jgi:hypothetical protein